MDGRRWLHAKVCVLRTVVVGGYAHVPVTQTAELTHRVSLWGTWLNTFPAPLPLSFHCQTLANWSVFSALILNEKESCVNEGPRTTSTIRQFCLFFLHCLEKRSWLGVVQSLCFNDLTGNEKIKGTLAVVE